MLKDELSESEGINITEFEISHNPPDSYLRILSVKQVTLRKKNRGLHSTDCEPRKPDVVSHIHVFFLKFSTRTGDPCYPSEQDTRADFVEESRSGGSASSSSSELVYVTLTGNREDHVDVSRDPDTPPPPPHVCSNSVSFNGLTPVCP